MEGPTWFAILVYAQLRWEKNRVSLSRTVRLVSCVGAAKAVKPWPTATLSALVGEGCQ